MTLTNWGKYPVINCDFRSCYEESEFIGALAEGRETIARGLGRCYGDSALSKLVIDTTKFNHFLEFDEKSGVLTCEAGVSLEEILETFIPKGWFLPVTPGTKFVTIGGAIASDVHGKNHHVSGSISSHIGFFDLLKADGTVVGCSKNENGDLFDATFGGMGLTGVVLRASIKLIRIETSYIVQNTVKAKNLREIMDLFESSVDYTYSVAWIDCLAKGNSLGRSILMRGEHAKADEVTGPKLKVENKKKLNIPFEFPSFVLNRFTVKAFNELYYGKAPKNKTDIVDYDTFFYPLDSMLNWNRIYGKRGFTQYQFVLPKEGSYEGLEKILKAISQSGQGSFLAVLKLFGKQDGMLNFPKEGYTLALDFPITDKLFPLLDKLDAIVKEFGGRLYLTKDVRMTKEMFESGYSRLPEFKIIKEMYDPNNRFSSLQSKRVGF